jgi:hypothetical protein
MELVRGKSPSGREGSQVGKAPVSGREGQPPPLPCRLHPVAVALPSLMLVLSVGHAY